MLFLIYLLKVSACMAVFYGLYFFVFRRFTFHTLNRFYLLGTLCLSFIVPYISFETTKLIRVEPALIIETPLPSQTSISSSFPDHNPPIATVQAKEQKPDWQFYLILSYASVAAILLILFLIKLLKIFRLSRPAVKVNNLWFVQRHETGANASFFNLIFLNTKELTEYEKAQVITHESVHAKQLHSIDVLVAEVCKIILWFNPIMYFYQKSLVEIHEFEADRNTVQMFDAKNYAHLLLKLGISYPHDLSNQFSMRPLSTRIQFLFSKRTANLKKLLYGLGLPLLALGVFAFAQRHEKIVYDKKKAGRPINRLHSLNEKGTALPKDSLVSKNNTSPLTSIIQADTSIKSLYTQLNPFSVPEIKMPSFTLVRFNTNEVRVILRIPMTPERYSFDFFNDGKFITSDVPDNDIKIFQAEKELIPSQDFDLVVEEGVVREVLFKAHVQSETLGLSIQFKRLTSSIPNVHPSFSSPWNYRPNMAQQIPYTPDSLRTRMPLGTPFMKDSIRNNQTIFRKR